MSTHPKEPNQNTTTHIPIYVSERKLEVSLQAIERILEEKKLVKHYQTIFDRLTQREKEVIPLVVYGHTNVEIAEQLTISRTTVETHRKNINRKLKSCSPYQLVRLAQAFNLV